MRILYLSQYFPPETGATQTRSFEMAKHLVKQGHEVTVIANVPNHPSGIIHPEFKKTWCKKVEMEEGVEAVYVKVLAFPDKSFYKRIAFYLSYTLAAVLAGILVCRKKYDCIYATSPPLFVGMAGLALHWIKRIPLNFEVRDLWPSSAVELGLVKNKTAIKMSTVLEEAIYRASKKIVVVTKGIRDSLDQRGFDNGKIAVIPNGATVDSFFKDDDAGLKKRRELGLEDKFTILYAGLIGEAQDLDTVLDAAEILKKEAWPEFIIVGEGPRLQELRAKAQSMKLENLRFVGGRPRSEMPAFFSAADAALVPLKDRAIFRAANPSKMFDAMCCETPVLLGVKGEAAGILKKARAGIAYEPENPADLVRAIQEMRSLEKSQREEMGKNGRRRVVKHHSRERAAKDLEQVLFQSLEAEK